MTVSGLSLPHALALAALAAILVLACYRLRDRRQQVVVAFLDLWQAADRASSPTSRRRRLRTLVSIGIQLVAIALLGVALLDPEIWQRRSAASHWVILLDTSASMGATEAGGSRLALAQRELLSLLDRLDDSTQVLLCSTDVRTTPLLPWTRDHGKLADAIRRQQPSDAVSNWRSALATAASYLEGKSRPRLLVVTDGTVSDWSELAEEPRPLEVPIDAILVGKTRRNLGILTLGARALPTLPRRAEVLIEVENDDAVAHDIGVEFSTNHRILEVKSLHIEAEQRRRSIIAEVPVTGHVIQARLLPLEGNRDALGADDEAFAVLPEAPRTRVAVISNGDLYLEAAVLADPWLEPAFGAVGTPIDPAATDAVLYAGCEPNTPLVRPTFFIDPPEGSRRFHRGPWLKGIGFDSWNQRSRLVAGLDLFDVQIEKARPFLPLRTDESVGFSGKSTILLRGERDHQPVVALAFSANQSDFVLRPVWPLFVRQILDELLGREQSETRQVRPFEPATFPAATNDATATIRRVSVDGSSQPIRQTVSAGNTWSFVPNRAGLFSVESAQRRGFVAANLNATAETRIAPLRPLRFGGRELGPPVLRARTQRRPHFVYCALGAVCLLCLEWWSFHRRWTT